MQILIARLGNENLSIDKRHNFFQTALSFENDSYRGGVILILNGLVNAMEPENNKLIINQVLSVVKMTLNDRFEPCH